MDANIKAIRDELMQLLKKMEQKIREEAMYQYMAWDEEVIYRMLLESEESREIPIAPPQREVRVVTREEYRHWP